MSKWIRRSFRKLKKGLLRRGSDPSAATEAGNATDEDDNIWTSSDRDELVASNQRLQTRLDAASLQYESLLGALLQLREGYQRALGAFSPLRKYEKMKNAIKDSVVTSQRQPADNKKAASSGEGLLNGAAKYMHNMHQYKKQNDKLNAMTKADLRLENKTLLERLESFGSTSYVLRSIFNGLQHGYQSAKELGVKRRYDVMKRLARDAVEQIPAAERRDM